MSNPGFYNGRHFTTYVDQVKQLKKDNQLEKAKLLLIYLVGATESEDRVDKRGVAPW